MEKEKRTRKRVRVNHRVWLWPPMRSQPYVVLQFYDVLRCRSFLTIDNLEADAITLGQRFESLCLNSGMMHEYILTSILLDKAKPLCIIKPLYCSF